MGIETVECGGTHRSVTEERTPRKDKKRKGEKTSMGTKQMQLDEGKSGRSVGRSCMHGEKVEVRPGMNTHDADKGQDKDKRKCKHIQSRHTSPIVIVLACLNINAALERLMKFVQSRLRRGRKNKTSMDGLS